jgi:Zn-dependent peptidase ImmA (M78 family)/transcriptional regulator with XRE-family HTH domain
MSGQRLKQLRLARGLSLDSLAAELGGIVTKQSLSKYEQGKAQPSPRIATKLAAVLGVKAIHLFSEPEIKVKCVAYRKASRLPKREQERIESWVSHTLEERVWLQQLMRNHNKVPLPIQEFSISTLEDVEVAAEKVRSLWKLGVAPIANVVHTLEENFVHVLELETGDGFDGLSAVAYGSKGETVAAAAITRSNIPGERQRLNLMHELGHLVLKIPKTIDEEKAAFRFGAAVLAPREVLYQEIGCRRTNLSLEELKLLKQHFGMSLQALLYRLRDLGIINESHYRDWCININKRGWRKEEPDEFLAERPQWLRQNVLHALSEKMITQPKAEELLKEVLPHSESLESIERQAFMQLPLAERRRILGDQADQMSGFYEQNQDWQDLQGDDFIDY